MGEASGVFRGAARILRSLTAGKIVHVEPAHALDRRVEDRVEQEPSSAVC
jgi:hypothetical protein